MFIKFAVDQAMEFDASLREYALEEQVKFEEQMEQDPNMGEEMTDEQNDLLELLLEKEPLVQHLDASKEFMEGKIQKMETEIMKAIKSEWDNLENNMTVK